MANPFNEVENPEGQLAAALAALEAKASRDITTLFSSTLDDTASFNRQLSTIKEDMAALRSATRELQILAEEQETCAVVATTSLNVSCAAHCSDLSDCFTANKHTDAGGMQAQLITATYLRT